MVDQVPATLPVVASAVERLLAEGTPLTREHVLVALREYGVDLGRDPAGTLDEVLDSPGLSRVQPLADGRLALLPQLLDGRIFTHRLTAAEVEHGFLEEVPDLVPLSVLTDSEPYLQLAKILPGFDDERLEERGIPDDAFDSPALLLPAEQLGALGARPGDLVGLQVTEAGFELVRIEPHGVARPNPDDLDARLTTILAAGGHEEPVDLDALIWTACAQDPDLFRAPLPPLSELVLSAGLAREGDQVAPAGFDFAAWRVARRVGVIQEVHGLDDDAAWAVLATVVLYERVADVMTAAIEAQRVGEDPGSVLGPAGDSSDEAHLEPRDDSDAPPLDRVLVRDTLEFLGDPDVAQAVLAEILGPDRRDAAAVGLFAETLEPMAPRAARPALQWFQARAVERLGNALEAEAAYEAAESLDPSWPPVLFDLARYAADRGDAERGLALLRRAGAGSDDPMVEVLEHFRPRARPGLARNQPCWCGSGRKYKQCHLNRERLPLEERGAWLYQKASVHVSDGPWRHLVIDVAAARSEHWGEARALLDALADPLVTDTVLFEGGAFAEFLAQRGALLPDDERLLAEEWLLSERSVFEVEAVRPGRGLSLRDVRTGDRHDVQERTASRQLKPADLICAHVVPVEDSVQIFGGVEPVSLGERDPLIALLDSEADPVELVGFLSARFAPPELQNTEGDPLVLCTATLRAPDPNALAGALDEIYEREDHAAGGLRWVEHVTTQGLLRLRASLSLVGEELTVQTNSDARMDRVLVALSQLQAAPTLVDDVRRQADDLREAMQRAEPGGRSIDAADSAPDPDDPRVAWILDEVARQYEQTWLDDHIPALAGLTPREAAADPTRRPDLVRLLDSFSGDPMTPGTMDPDRLRAALGLS